MTHSGEITQSSRFANLVMNDLCYEYSQDGVFLIVSVVFLFKNKLGAQTKLNKRRIAIHKRKTITTR